MWEKEDTTSTGMEDAWFVGLGGATGCGTAEGGREFAGVGVGLLR